MSSTHEARATPGLTVRENGRVLGQEIVAYVVAERVPEPELIDWVARQLVAHTRPRKIHLLDELPRNTMGKIQKQLLMGRYRYA